MRLPLGEYDRLIGDALHMAGHVVDRVRDPASAQSALSSERFDFVLLDQRRHSGRAQTALRHCRVRLDSSTRGVTLDGAPLRLSARVFAVLQAVMERPGAMQSRTQIDHRLCGRGDAVDSNAVPVYSHQLRRTLGSA
jgi:DNA-binding response OmpR family regulator